MSVFGRFPPRLREAIVGRLGWSALRPVQELAGEALLDGKNAIILAPTAGGKTEAAIFPFLAGMLEQPPLGMALLYVAPLRALLNNQADRLGQYAEMVGLRRFLWHGDVGGSARQRFLRSPAEILMTTPESLEVMLLSRRVPQKALFAGLRYVVIDEIHALAGADRGAQLLSVLERIVDLATADVQRAGLSATVGNPAALLRWIQGTSKREGMVVEPPKAAARRQILVAERSDPEQLAETAARLAKGNKSLFFCQSRRTTEGVAEAMRRYGTRVFVHHSSVSREERAIAEEEFYNGADSCIVCTSTLELGIDIGDLDRVLQANAPDTVGSFLQRLGRTGRREGQIANTTFLCEDPEAVLQAAALVALAKRGWVEDVTFNRRSWAVLVHQLLAMSLAGQGQAHQGVTWDAAWAHLSRIPDFEGIHRAELDRLVEWLLLDESLRMASGRLVLGPKAEHRFGRRNFMDLYAVFSSVQSYTVLTRDGQPVGTLAQDFVDRLQDDVSCFLLAGRPWVVLEVRHDDRRIVVELAPKGREPTWGGILPRFLGFEVCQEVKAMLRSGEEPTFLDPVAVESFVEYRKDLAQVLESDPSIQRIDGELRWWTFAGGRINYTLRYALESLDPTWKVIPDNFLLRLIGFDGTTRDFLSRIAALREPEFWENETMWGNVAKGLPSFRISKFQPLMPPWVEREVIATYLLDLDATFRWLADTTDHPLRAILEAATPTVEDEDQMNLLGRQRKALAAPPMARDRHRPIHWIGSDEELMRAIEEIKGAERIGLDTETTLGTKALCLIQIATETATYLIDTLAIRRLAILGQLLSTSLPEKLIHNAAFERQVLGRYGLELAGVVDILLLSREIRGRGVAGGHSLQAVCARELGIALDKRQQTSDWSQRPLGVEQVEYAALDAEMLFRIWAQLQPPSIEAEEASR